MPFTYQIRLNGEPIFATLGATVIDKLEEPLDEGALHIPITVKDVEYDMLGLLNIQVSKTGQTTKSFSYLVLSDKVTVKSKAGIYSHDLQVIEYTYKFDKYLVNALTFTKPFEKKVRAPFTYKDVNSVTTGLLIAPYYFYDDIFINETYFINKEYTFEQVSQMDILNDTISYIDDDFIKKDVYISFDGSTPLNLSTSDRTHTFTTKGFKNIEIGYYDGVPTFTPVFTYHINVINERRYTLWDMLEIVRAVVPIESKFYHDYYNTRLFDIDSDYETLFKKIEMPQMFFQKQTLRQILNTLFKYINAISRLKYIEDEYDILTIDEFNKITGSFNLKGIVDYSSKQNSQNYATVAVTYLEKSLQTNFRENASVITPSANAFKTVRATNVQLTQDGGNFNLPLEYEMYEPTKIEVVIPFVELEQSRSLDSSMTTMSVAQKLLTDYNIELTERFLNKDFWDLKDFTVNFPTYSPTSPFIEGTGLRSNKGGNFFWQRNTKKIDLSYTIGSVIKENVITTVIQEALNEAITRIKYIFDTSDYSDGYGPLNATKVNVNNIETTFNSETSTTDLLFRNLKFNIEYITFGNPTAKIEREDTHNFKYYSELRVNQQARITDFSRASRDAYGQIQRAGVPNITFSKRHFDLDDILNVGMIDTNGYIITHRSLQFQNEFINARYQATLNHNRLNEYNGIDQEYRVFENPQLGFNRVDYYNDYVFIDSLYNTEDPTLSIQPTFLKDTTIPKIFSNLRNNHIQNDLFKITYAMVRTDGFLENYPDGAYENAIMIPVQSFGGKNSLVFEFGFDNNLHAGNALYEQTLNSGSDTYFNEPILYGDSQGFFDKIWFGMGDTSNATTAFPAIGETGEDYFTEGHKYPLVRSTSFATNQSFEMQTGDINPMNASHNPIIAYKDASSNYYVSYGVIVKSKVYGRYVIGNHFYTQNSLVNKISNDFNVYLYKYTSDTKYGIFDDYTLKDGVDDEYDTPVLLSLSNTSVSASTGKFEFSSTAIINPSIHKSWAIADENGNLFMACNEPYNGFKAILRHFNSDLMGIGNKLFTSSTFEFFDETANLDYSITPLVFVNSVNDSFSVSTYMNYGNEVELGYDAWETASLSFGLSTNVDIKEINDSINVSTAIEYSIDEILGDDYWETIDLDFNLSTIVDMNTVNDSIDVSTILRYNVDEILGDDGWETVIETQTLSTTTLISNYGSLAPITTLQYNISPVLGDDYDEIPYIDYDLSTTTLISNYGSLNVSTNMQYDIEVSSIAQIYAWASTSETSTTVDQTCDEASDLGNVKSYQSTSCSFSGGNIYFSSTDETTSQPSCSDGATYITCTYQDTLDMWSCRDFEGTETTTTIYRECKLVNL